MKTAQPTLTWPRTLAIAAALATSLSCGPKTAPAEAPRAVPDNAIATDDPAGPDQPTAVTAPTGDALVEVSCTFADGWYAVVPRKAIPEEPEYVMQALIGLTEDPGFWAGMKEYQSLKPYAAQKCGSDPITVKRPPGQYILYIGWAAGYQVTNYKNNGRIEHMSLAPGARMSRVIKQSDLDADLPCISCPFLLAWSNGKYVELGQILIDRYNKRRAGTDARKAKVTVRRGLVKIKLAEREPETSYVDLVEVWAGGRKLRPARNVPAALTRVDNSDHIMKNGDEIELEFIAPIKRGELDVEIRVGGYYLLEHLGRR